MLKLIKLELQKNRIQTYLTASICIFVFGLAMCFMLTFIPFIEHGANRNLPFSEDLKMLMEWDTFCAMIAVLFLMAFGVMSGVMHTKFTVEEYVGKRSILLFTYPQSRTRILFAKCSLVFFFTVAAMIICTVAALLFFGFISNLLGIMPQRFEMTMLPDILTLSGIYGLMSGAIGLVAMRVGFWKQSLVATVVTSVILCTPFGNTITFFPQQSNLIRLVGMVVLLVVGFAIFAELMTKVNRMEVK